MSGLNLSFAQGNHTVYWQFESVSTVNYEVVLKLTAHVAQGWHLYSQHMNENGPMPTRVTYTVDDGYVLIGQPEEKGNAVKFYDDLYGMEIIWYSGTVTFTQRIKLTRPTTTVKGTVEYMTCNDHICIPSKQDFTIDLQPKKKSF